VRRRSQPSYRSQLRPGHSAVRLFDAPRHPVHREVRDFSSSQTLAANYRGSARPRHDAEHASPCRTLSRTEQRPLEL
jgi:hypothetical protein